jgi:hypothetical protein
MKLPTIPGGNTEAVTTAKAIRRYTIECMRQDRCSVSDAHLNTFTFLAGVSYANGVTLPQMFGCLVHLCILVIRGKVKR